MTEPAKDFPGLEHEMDPKPEYMPRFPGSGRLKGKRVLITGGDSGIGRAVCVLFAREGADVAFAYLSEDRDAEETVRLIEAEGARALSFRGDLGVKAHCHDVVAKTVEAFGGLDVLINNAAEQHRRDDLTDIPEESLERTFRSNVYSYFFMVEAVLPHLQPGSSVINTSSVNAFMGMGLLLDYSSTRGASLALSRSLAERLVEKGIRVNSVAPGPIWTPFIPVAMTEEEMKTFGSQVPMGRAGQPNEVAPSFLFLACDDSSYMTGQTLHPNGGVIVGG
ncbi:MAG: SDR family oxidoreductase [Pseudomonadota bacterium]